MKSKATSAPASSSGSRKRASTPAKNESLRVSGKSAMPEDVRRNTYTQDRPFGLHVKHLPSKG